MESIKIRREQPRDECGTMATPSPASSSKVDAARRNMDISVSNIETITSSSNEKAMVNTSAVNIPTMKTTPAADKPEPRQGVDLMDLDIGQETMQPVLQFTTSSIERQPCRRIMEDSTSSDQTVETTERVGALNAIRVKTPRPIQAELHARESAPTPKIEAHRRGIYTRPELESLRLATATAKVTIGIAEKFAQQQNAFLIGEHVHKTRYHTAAFLTEEFEKLSISDKKHAKRTMMNIFSTEKPKTVSDNIPAKPAAASDLPTTETSRANPFGPTPFKRRDLSLPAHLSNLTTTADHGAGARAQYSGGNDNLLATSARQSLGDVKPAARPVRRNKINETGFIALAANRVNVAVGKKGEDPLLVAYKRGL